MLKTSSNGEDTSEITERIKNKINAFIFDFDGTIKSSAEPDCVPLDLIKKIIERGIHVGIVTASGVSVFNGLAEQIIELIKENNFTTPVYLGIANGIALYKLDRDGRKEIYNYSIDLDDIKKILEIWKNVIAKIGIKDEELMEKGIKTFKEFLISDWSEFIPNELLSFSKQESGKCFVEKLKITLVMPKNEIFKQDKFINLIQVELDRVLGSGNFVIDMGDDVFAHITKKPNMAPKLFALKRIMKDLDLDVDQVVAFGDMPLGNDKGLLIDSGLPYSFTNKIYKKKNNINPPFVLLNSELTPVASVYKMVENLLY